MVEIIKFTVSKEHDGTKAGRYLRTVCSLSARTLAQLKRTENGLTINGQLLRSIDNVYAGDVIEMRLQSEVNSITPVEGELDILFEDGYILIVNKPAGMPVHPVKKHQLDTLANIVSYRYMNSGSDFLFRAVNRLDSDTSGAVIIARDRHTASLLQGADIEKHYIAVCHGKIAEKGTVDSPIALKPDSKIVRHISENGKPAVTHYEPIVSLNDATVIDLHLETGRTHQIRCHMSSIGHPLLGDDLYGGSIELIPRQALHCHKISFIHPILNTKIDIKADVPKDIAELIDILSEGDLP